MRTLPSRSTARRSGRTFVVTLAALIVTLALVAPAAAAPGGAGFRTDRDAMLSMIAPGASARPLLSVGDRLSSGYRFEAIPDGIAFRQRGQGRVDVYVNHETSTVPFPYDPTRATPSLNDFTDSLLSRLTLNRRSAGILAGDYAIGDEANYQRFCSNFLAGAAEGFDREILFTNEEATDVVNREGTAWPATPAFGSHPEQAGVVVAFDIQSRRYRTIYGMGRHNHENSVAIPGFEELVVLSGDDTFSAPASQLYMYRAANADDVWNDRGSLWAFKSDDPTVNDYGDLASNSSVSGTFIEVPRSVALGDQNALETWSNQNGVFQFIRLEDIAYDRNHPNVVYMADTGEPRAVPGPGSAYMTRGGRTTTGPYMNGRIFRLELDTDDPDESATLSVLIDADAGGYNNPAALHQPDNLETTADSLLIQEDPGGHNQYSPTDAGGTTARIWRYDFESEALTPVARVDQSQDPAARQGNWESSGIIDASAAFGPGAFLVTVQAHSRFVETAPGPDLVAPAGADWTYKREDGQLLLIRIPGA
ncbi:MAG: hypothetical protein H0X16_07415 [Chloroflexi bacterium]|nr:hypothetical protein [Chloroflexota bacterium]